MHQYQTDERLVEPLSTVEEAADAIGVPVWKLRRAVKSGHIPTYRLHNSRRLVRVSEVNHVIERARVGGIDE